MFVTGEVLFLSSHSEMALLSYVLPSAGQPKDLQSYTGQSCKAHQLDL